jgi:hypothetical protein
LIIGLLHMIKTGLTANIFAPNSIQVLCGRIKSTQTTNFVAAIVQVTPDGRSVFEVGPQEGRTRAETLQVVLEVLEEKAMGKIDLAIE